MKRLFFCILCFATTQGFTQIRVGVQAGFNTANLWQADAHTGLNTGLSSSPISAWNAGIMGELDLRHNWYLVPSLLYFETGSHLGNAQAITQNPDQQASINFTDTHLKMYSLRLPVNFIYKIQIDSSLKVLLGGGPYVALALSGSEKGHGYGYSTASGANTSDYVSVPINNTLQISNQASYPNGGISRTAPFDIGGQILAGVEFRNKYQFSFAYSRGFSFVYRNTYANTGNNVFTLTLGYFLFGHNRKPQL